MYEERQCNNVYNQVHGINQQDKQPSGNQKQITATSSNKNTTGGMTSSSTDKPAGQWMTYGGQGKPMEIDAKKQKQRSEGHCFQCDKKGHLSRDCPHKKVAVCAVEAAPVEPLSKDTKIEEVKD